jgi:hypothetical protein
MVRIGKKYANLLCFQKNQSVRLYTLFFPLILSQQLKPKRSLKQVPIKRGISTLANKINNYLNTLESWGKISSYGFIIDEIGHL